MYLTQKAHQPPHGSPRHGRDRGAAVPGGDGPRAHAARKTRGGGQDAACAHRDGARRRRQHADRPREESVVAGRGRAQLRSLAEQPVAARAVPRLPDDHQQHRRAKGAEAVTTPEIGGDHFRSSAVFLTQTHPKQTEGSDVNVGDLARPDVRAAVRAGHADPVDAAVHRERRPGGRLRLRLRVRLHRHDQLGEPERAAADDPRSARGVRSALRRRRDAGAARREPPHRSQHPRLGDREVSRIAKRPRPGGSPRASISI